MAGLKERLEALGVSEQALVNLEKREQAKADAVALKAGEPSPKSIASLLKRVEAIEKILGI